MNLNIFCPVHENNGNTFQMSNIAHWVMKLQTLLHEMNFISNLWIHYGKCNGEYYQS